MWKYIVLLAFFFSAWTLQAQPPVSWVRDDRSIIFTNTAGERLRITPYGNHIIRVQAVRKEEDFFPDDHYEMVESHQWPGHLELYQTKNAFRLSLQHGDSSIVYVDRQTMLVSFAQSIHDVPFLKEKAGISWKEDSISVSFIYDRHEHFTGLGHSYYGRAESLDLRGQLIQRNYGTEHGQQAPLLVPFYLSSKGYGIFVNSTFPNAFNFGKYGQYNFSINGNGRMDFFVITGSSIPAIIDQYTQLTGRPRFPPKAIFGLALSDKGNDHLSAIPSDEKWWKEKIMQHRNAGFPLDHVVNDNRWRAGGGERCRSYFEWDTTRFPDPHEYEQWIQKNGLYMTLDFNRCIAAQSDGWLPSYNIPRSDSIDFKESAPDFTRQEVRDWFWNLQWRKALDPALGYPGDALWIDEFDEMGKASPEILLGNGRTWQEMKNYWFFLIAKALVQEGWDKKFNGTKRPFVWVRGMTAGAQRYATLWSGDIKPEYSDMKNQVRGMQLAGLSGFPFWGHDAGGFYDWEKRVGPNDAMYRQWAMAFGSFSPFWKPHGVGQSRWPLDRSAAVQKDAKTYSDLRYELMPYTYTYAHQSAVTGLPIARAMMISYPGEAMAWKSDLQYMWGNEMLVAPNCSDSDNVKVWLPKGLWYDYWDDKQIKGQQVLSYPSPTGKLPLFVRAGSIIPMSNFALSTAMIPKDSLSIHIYTGTDGSFTLYEDDGISEAYKTKNESSTTGFTFIQSTLSLSIAATTGSYEGSTSQRAYTISFHGLQKPVCFELNGKRMKITRYKKVATPLQQGCTWDGAKKILIVYIPKTAVTKTLNIKRAVYCPEL